MIKVSKIIYYIPFILLLGSCFTIYNHEPSMEKLYLIYNFISCISLTILGIFLCIKPLTYIKHVGLWDDEEITSENILSIRSSGILCIIASILSLFILI